MRWPAFTVVAITLTAAGGAGAQDGPYRRFTRPPIDPNNSNRIIYAPVASAFPGARPPEQPHDVSAATWYTLPLGATNAGANKVLDDAQYRVERFTAVRGDNGMPLLEVVVVRSPGPVPGAAPPQLRVVHPQTHISAAAFPAATDGGRYRFLVRPPHLGLAPEGDVAVLPSADRYELRFMPAGSVRYPPTMRQAGTFAGAGVEVRMAEGPPRLPVQERVAGKRLEFRSAQSAPVVTFDQRVAGRRQELRNRR